MEFFVDFQGFKDSNNDFIVKEFAIALTNGKRLQHWMVRSPYPFCTLSCKAKRQYTWVSNNHHGIKWQDGDTTLKSVQRQLEPLVEDSVMYVKGLEKAKVVRKLFTNCLVVELDESPALKDLTTPDVFCIFHCQSVKVCALNNVLKLVDYYN